MGLNKGHAIRAAHLQIVTVRSTLVVFEGQCGERFTIRVEDWPDLRKMIDEVIAEAKHKSYVTISLPESI